MVDLETPHRKCFTLGCVAKLTLEPAPNKLRIVATYHLIVFVANPCPDPPVRKPECLILIFRGYIELKSI